MIDAWVVVQKIVDGGHESMAVNGVYSTRETALSACVDESMAAVRFVIDRDYTGIDRFHIITQAMPGGIIATSDGPLPLDLCEF